MVSTESAGVFWPLITRLGEAQILLPALLLACALLAWRRGAARWAGAWLTLTATAAALTTATKVAFIGFGWGLPALDFTGISGHAMFAAAIWPPLLRLAEGHWPLRRPGSGVWLGALLAALVAVSRVMVGAHSWSEVAAGFALGGAVSAAALWRPSLPRQPLWRGVPLLLAAWGVLGTAAAPPSRTHDWVTRLALAAARREQPFLRGAPAPGGARLMAPAVGPSRH
ncbi:MAG: phosphatidic acid phosphatase [Burkholderiales bacterium PBB5]|nr:MAG: phosphatidic acid phosphatase [Burkholderiales bacterium PBB5]